MHRSFVLMLFLVLISAMSACGRDDESLEPFGYHDSKLSDSRYKIIEIGSFNYTDYNIYDVYLLPPDKDNLDYAADSSGDSATPPTATYWRGGGGGALEWHGIGGGQLQKNSRCGGFVLLMRKHMRLPTAITISM